MYIGNLEQDFVITLLGSLLLKNHELTQDFMEEVMKNTKFTKLAIIYLYIILQCFKVGNLDIVPHIAVL